MLKLQQKIFLKTNFVQKRSNIKSHRQTHSQKRIFMFEFLYIISLYYTGCFMTWGHYCRRWFPRSLWSKKFM